MNLTSKCSLQHCTHLFTCWCTVYHITQLHTRCYAASAHTTTLRSEAFAARLARAQYTTSRSFTAAATLASAHSNTARIHHTTPLANKRSRCRRSQHPLPLLRRLHLHPPLFVFPFVWLKSSCSHYTLARASPGAMQCSPQHSMRCFDA